MFKENNRMWNHVQVKAFVADVKRKCGVGWTLLGECIQVALIEQKVLEVVVLQDRTEVSTAAVRCLRNDCLRAAGLGDED